MAEPIGTIISMEEAERRFGKLTVGHERGMRSFVEFKRPEGTWRPQVDGMFRPVGYELFA